MINSLSISLPTKSAQSIDAPSTNSEVKIANQRPCFNPPRVAACIPDTEMSRIRQWGNWSSLSVSRRLCWPTSNLTCQSVSKKRGTRYSG